MGIRSKEEKIMQIAAHTVMILLSLLAVLPFVLLISSSLSSEAYALKYGYKFIPGEFSLKAYEYLFQQWDQIGRAYSVTVVVTVIGTAAGIFIVSLLAYGLVQKDVPGVKIISFLVLLTMLFNGGLVSTYMIYTNVLHVKNTIMGLLLPNLLMSGFTVILVKNYFATSIPAELYEAAELDGAGQFSIFFRIIMPLSTPILATVGLMSAISYWNDWQNGLYYISDRKLYSIQQLLNEMNNNVKYLTSNASDMAGMDISTLPSVTMRLAIAVIAILPILCVYPFFQKYFAKGIVMGAVKG